MSSYKTQNFDIKAKNERKKKFCLASLNLRPYKTLKFFYAPRLF